MKTDLSGLALRWAVSWFLLSLVVLFLYLSGAAQSFLEQTQAELFALVRWGAWLGLLGTGFLLVPLTRRKVRQLTAALVLGLGFAGLFLFVLVWGSWIYPEAGWLPW